MLRSILVPLDGSSFGEHALPLAAGLARRAGATLHLAHVHQVIPPATVAGVAVMDSLDLHLRQDEQAYLADVTRRLHEKGPLQVRTTLLEGEVTAALEAQAARVEADLVVMSTHGRGAMGRFWLGSVADDLVHDLTRPVLLVHPHEGQPDLKREPDLKTILLPLDGTQLAERSIGPAVQLARLFESAFVLVRIVQPVLRPSYLPEGGTIGGLAHTAVEEIEKGQERLQAEAQSYLDRTAEFLRQQCVRVSTRVVVDESPAAAILREAQLRQAGLIAMETHGRRGLARLVAGSIADKIVRGGTVPVLLHRAPRA
jgi:nucleotide-binding universal stress UspA family protein